MGIQDINKFLDSKNIVFRSSAPLKGLSGYRIAIDTCNWVYTYMSTAYKRYLHSAEFSFDENIKIIGGCVEPLMLTFKHQEVFKLLLSDLFSFITLLSENNITAVFVWDGEHPVQKVDTKKKRNEDRESRLETADNLALTISSAHPLKRNPEDLEKWKKLVQTSLRLPSRYFKEIKKTIGSLGFCNLQAEADAEKLCAELNLSRYVAGIWSRDTDLYALGTPTMITAINDYEFEFIQTEDIRTELERVTDQEWSIERFRDFCIMCGCDFNTRISQLGPSRAFALLCKCLTLEQAQKTLPEKNWTDLNISVCRDLLTSEYSGLNFNDSDLNFNKERFQKSALKRLSKYGFKSLLPLFRESVEKIQGTKNI